MSSNWLVHGADLSPTTVNSATDGAVGDAAHRGQRALRITILLHPEGRFGESVELPEPAPGVPIAISRSTPEFRGAGAAGGLNHPRVSRRPLWLCREGDALVLNAAGEALRVAVDGAPLSGTVRLPLSQLSAGGALLDFANCVLLWLHISDRGPIDLRGGGLIGLSAAIEQVRRQIARVAPSAATVLVRGESGVGKELVARAIVAGSPRRERPYLAVNMAAIPLQTAASELFGHGRGAFTGAVASRSGFFEQADGGTLFLDEIGETPVELQPALLRVLDVGEIQPLGQPPRRVDVRVISATDADLDTLIAERRFRGALFHRLSSVVIDVPPLRERPIDIPILFQHFLQDALQSIGAKDRLRCAAGDESPWLRADLLYRVMKHGFPGNVRELKNLALNVATASHDAPRAELPAEFGAYRRPNSLPPAARHDVIDEESVRDALRRNDFNLAKTAVSLGISRNTLVDAMARIDGLRHAKDLDALTIRRALDASAGSLDHAARELQVSVHGLRLRMNALSIAQRG